MKKIWMILSTLPVAAFSENGDNDLLNASENHLAYGDEKRESLADSLGAIEYGDFENEGLSLFEIDERDESLIPWSVDDLSYEGLPSFIEKKNREEADEFDDAFAYEDPFLSGKEPYEPSLERVPQNHFPSSVTEKVVSLKPRETLNSDETIAQNPEQTSSDSEAIKPNHKFSENVEKNPPRKVSRKTERKAENLKGRVPKVNQSQSIRRQRIKKVYKN